MSLRLPWPPTRGAFARALIVAVLLAITAVGVTLAAREGLAEYHSRHGDEAFRRQRYPAASLAYGHALGYRPGSARLHLMAARTARLTANAAAAREHLARCRALQGGVSEEQQLEAYLLRAETGDVEEVHPLLLPYLGADSPSAPLVLEALVRGYMALHQLAPAWHCLTLWTELQPDGPEVAFRKGLWLSQQQSLRAAAEEFRRVLALDPERSDARLALVEVLKMNREFEEAAEHCRDVLRLEPVTNARGNARARLSLAQCLAEEGHFAEARATLVEIPDENLTVEGLWLHGLITLREGDAEGAEPWLQRALAADPFHHDAAYTMMLCWRQLRRNDEARAMQDRYEAIDRAQKRLLTLTGTNMKASPRDPAVHCELGEVYLQLGMPQRGLRWLQSALRLDPRFRRAHEQLRDYHEARGEEGREQAEYHRRQLSDDPSR